MGNEACLASRGAMRVLHSGVLVRRAGGHVPGQECPNHSTLDVEGKPLSEPPSSAGWALPQRGLGALWCPQSSSSEAALPSEAGGGREGGPSQNPWVAQSQGQGTFLASLLPSASPLQLSAPLPSPAFSPAPTSSPVTLKVKVAGHLRLSTSSPNRYLPRSQGRGAGIRLRSSEGRVSLECSTE